MTITTVTIRKGPHWMLCIFAVKEIDNWNVELVLLGTFTGSFSCDLQI